MNTIIADMTAKGETSRVVSNEGNDYTIIKKDGNQYNVTAPNRENFAGVKTQTIAASYNPISKVLTYETGYTLPSGTTSGFKNAIENAPSSGNFTYSGHNYSVEVISKVNQKIIEKFSTPVVTYVGTATDSGFESALTANLDNGEFVYSGTTYDVKAGFNGNYTVYRVGDPTLAYFSTKYVFDYYDENFTKNLTTTEKDAFEKELYKNVFGSDFSVGGINYRMKNVDGKLVLCTVKDSVESNFANLSTFVARRYNGEDTMSIAFKKQFEAKEKKCFQITNRKVLSRSIWR